jgi:threonine synthase
VGGTDLRYVSTRGEAPPAGFAEALLGGLAPDGGLFVPEAWPRLDMRGLAGAPYATVLARVMQPFVGEAVAAPVLERLCAETASAFRHPAVVPLVQIGPSVWVQELFHGPTLAFKDLALQLVGRLFDQVLAERQGRLTIVGATSGDTGSAAIAACAGRPRLSIAILHPAGRTSAVQRRQMTTVQAGNVLNLAVEGSFDDCQDLVKAMFADEPFRRDLALSAVNSINWARVAAQVAYYAAASLALGADRPIDVAVPTGNFGNVLAGWVARRMGVRLRRLIVATNRNDILARFLAQNDMSRRPVEPSLSPSMDIQVSSNFERLLFELLDRDGAATRAAMAAFRASGRLPVPEAAWRRARETFEGFRLDDDGALAVIARLDAAGVATEPHSAAAIAAAEALRDPDGTPVVALATAHPAKFPDAVERATGKRPALPPALADLFDRPERFATVPARLPDIQAQIRAFALRNAA